MHGRVGGVRSYINTLSIIYPRVGAMQRDERLGWMGDAALSVEQAMYNFGTGSSGSSGSGRRSSNGSGGEPFFMFLTVQIF